MAGDLTQALARFAATLTYDQIPDSAREHCKNLLLDAVACALAGKQGEETHQVAAFAAALAQSTEASIIGGDRLSLAGSTLLNGFLITAVTMCDVHRATLTHITPEVVPPALAIAERDGLSGRDLLVALAAQRWVLPRLPRLQERGAVLAIVTAVVLVGAEAGRCWQRPRVFIEGREAGPHDPFPADVHRDQRVEVR